MITTIPEVIKELGGPTKLAKILGCTPQNISLWELRKEIPPGWHYRLHLLLSAKNVTFNAHRLFGIPKGFGKT